jgi:hypothetical protein
VVDALDAVLDAVRAAALPDALLRSALLPLALGRGRAQVPALAARLWPDSPPSVGALLAAAGLRPEDDHD